MHRTLLAALAALTVVAAVTAAAARPNGDIKMVYPPNMADIRTALDAENIISNLPAAMAEFRQKGAMAFTRANSASKNTARKLTRNASPAAFSRSLNRSPEINFKSASIRKAKLGRQVSELRDVLKASAIFKSKAQTAEMRGKMQSDVASPKRRDDDDKCMLELSIQPTNEELMEFCDDTCCYYKPQLAMAFGLVESDVDTLICAKDGNDFCVTTVPEFADPDVPTNAEMNTVCTSPCADSWVGISMLEDLVTGMDRRSSNRRTSNLPPGGKDWAGLSDWICSKDGEDFCVLTTNELEDFSDPPTEGNLETLCGSCKDFYFDLFTIEANPDAATMAEDTLCAKDDEDNFCMLTMPTFEDEENPTQAEIDSVCSSPCKVPWITAMFMDDDEDGDDEAEGVDMMRRSLRRNSLMAPDFTALADLLCTKNGEDYCVVDMYDLDGMDDPTPQNLTNICGGCKTFYTGVIGMDEGLTPAMVDTVLCSKDGDDFCLLVMPNIDTEDMPDVATLDSVCGATAKLPCTDAWIGTIVAFGDDDKDEPPSEMRRSSHTAPTAAQMSAAFCSKDSATGDYCVLALNEAMDPFEDGLSKEGLDAICTVGTCYSHAMTLATMFEDPEEDGGGMMDDMMPVLCSKKANGNYCVLDLQTAAENMKDTGNQGMGQGQGQGGPADLIPPAFLDLMCGECIAKTGTAGAGLLFGLLFLAGGDMEDGQRRKLLQSNGGSEDEGMDVMFKLMCMKDDTGYCLRNQEAAALLSDESDLEKLFPNPDVPPGQRKQVAKKFCENNCVNSFVNVFIEISQGTLIEECMPGDELFAYKMLVNGCVKNGPSEYCVETVGNELASGIGLQQNCGISETFEWDGTCSDECSAAAESLYDKWGCCAASLDFPIISDVDSSCSLTAPAQCAASGVVQMDVDVPNLRKAWLDGKLTDARIRNAISKDVGSAVSVSPGLVRLKGNKARSDGGSKLDLEIRAPSKELARGMLKKLKGARRAAVDVAFTSLTAEIPEAERATAMEDPNIGLTGAVDTTSVAAEGEELEQLEAEIDAQSTPETTPSPSSRLLAASWLAVAALLASLATLL
mmetsp:Transcript_58803/g.138613  ORF Transcript_58803/g.138613 Transcript_58803/m.138613 type:complete len:1075 (-) Transcript_58803:191-3415(-)